MIHKHAHPERKDFLRIIASIESARAVMDIKEVCVGLLWSEIQAYAVLQIASSSPLLDALLFAAEDFCADTGIRRTTDRKELYYARSAVVLAAKAYSLSAIDLVCIVSWCRPGQILSAESLQTELPGHASFARRMRRRS